MNTFVKLTRDSLYAIVFHLAPRFANVLLYITIGRLLGPSEAGVFGLATTYLIIFTTIPRGLDDLVVRQVSREPDQASCYLTSFLLLRAVLSAGLYGTFLLVVRSAFVYAESTMGVISIMALSVIPENLAYVPQSILLAERRFGVLAGVLASANLLKLIGGWIVLFNQGSLQHVAWIWLIGALLAMLPLLLIAVRQVGGVRRSDWLHWRPLAQNWRPALSFLLITGMLTLESQIDTVVLSAFRDEAEVGWYGAATTVTFSLVMFAQAYRFAVYPLMTRYALHAPEKLASLYERSMRYLGTLVLPMVTGIVLLAPQIVSLVFGSQFQPSIDALRILIPALVFIFLNVPDSRMMLVKDRQSRSLLFLVGSLVVNVALNLALDPILGAIGAATARVCSSFLYFLLTHLYVVRHLMPLKTLQTLLRALTATLIMALAVWLTRSWPLAVSIAAGVVVYVGMLWVVKGIPPADLLMIRELVEKRREKSHSP
jgi:O-antigen/teichoic acid export membrane protein